MMRLDHVLLALRDLDPATRQYKAVLGMSARVGGVHPGRGTHNSLVHFRTAYLELIALIDPASERAGAFNAFLTDGEGGYQFALAVASLEDASEALRARGLLVDPPRDGSRRTPTGELLRWRSADLRAGPAGPGPTAPPLPFLIEWTDDDAGRAWFASRVDLASHPIAWGEVDALLIATDAPAELAAEYQSLFGWHLASDGDGRELTMPGGDAVNAGLGPAPRVALVGPKASGQAAAGRALAAAATGRLDRRGAGVLGLRLRTGDVARVTAELRQRGVTVHDGRPGQAVVDPGAAHGFLLELVE